MNNDCSEILTLRTASQAQKKITHARSRRRKSERPSQDAGLVLAETRGSALGVWPPQLAQEAGDAKLFKVVYIPGVDTKYYLQTPCGRLQSSKKETRTAHPINCPRCFQARCFTMESRHRRCGLVAAMALLANNVADVRGFAFTLQQKASSMSTTPSASAAGHGRRASATREVCPRGRRSGSVALAPSWNLRRTRTALRCVRQDARDACSNFCRIRTYDPACLFSTRVQPDGPSRHPERVASIGRVSQQRMQLA